MPIDDDGLELDPAAFLPEDDDFDDAPDDLLPEDEMDSGPDDSLPEDDDAALAASQDAAFVQSARRRYGTLGAVVAGGMLGLDKALGRPVKEEAPVEWETPGDPIDIDRKGITVPLDEDSAVHSQPGPPKAAGAADRSVTKRRRG